jgi:hypothetical protein
VVTSIRLRRGSTSRSIHLARRSKFLEWPIVEEAAESEVEPIR